MTKQSATPGATFPAESSVSHIAEDSGPRGLLCADAADDGLYMGKNMDWPCCVGENGRCGEFGCFWRRFHQLSAEQYRRPAQRELRA